VGKVGATKVQLVNLDVAHPLVSGLGEYERHVVLPDEIGEDPAVDEMAGDHIRLDKNKDLQPPPPP
jgi:hypothetical protein